MTQSPKRMGGKALRLTLALGASLLLAGCFPGGGGVVQQGWSAPAVHEGALYVGSRSGRFFKLAAGDVSEAQPVKLDSKNMVPQWQFPPASSERSGLGAMYGRAAVGKDLVYVTMNRMDQGFATKGQVTALDRNTGAERWSFETDGRIFSSPTLSSEGGGSAPPADPPPEALYVADDTGTVYALETGSGRPIWKKRIAQKRFWGAPAVAGDSVYIGSMDQKLYALKAATGEVRWTFAAGGAITSRPLIIGNGVYVGAYDRTFYRLDAASGNRVWAFEGDGWFWNDALASPDGASIYVGSLGQSFYALDAASGTARWTFRTEAPVRAAPVLAGDIVYVVAQTGRIFALDTNRGTQRRSTPILGAKALASPAWAAGYLYVHDMDEELHKIAAPASSGVS